MEPSFRAGCLASLATVGPTVQANPLQGRRLRSFTAFRSRRGGCQLRWLGPLQRLAVLLGEGGQVVEQATRLDAGMPTLFDAGDEQVRQWLELPQAGQLTRQLMPSAAGGATRMVTP
jgi:hypothetical protein